MPIITGTTQADLDAAAVARCRAMLATPGHITRAELTKALGDA